jgi:hypothetical protein
MGTREYRPVIITRGHIGQIASFIGIGALVIGLLGFIWQGGLTPYITGMLVTGAVGIALWLLFTPREFIDFVTGRQMRRGTLSVFSTFLLIGIVAMGYILLERALITMDMTDARRFSLSPETRQVLTSVQRDIRITGFYSPRLAAAREVDDQFLRQYELESGGRITREYIDPIEQPAIAANFRAQDGDIFLTYLNEDGTLDMSTTSFVPLGGGQERDLTRAIAQMLARGNFSVYFDASFEQLSPFDDSARGLSLARQLLEANGFQTHMLNLETLAQQGQTVPDNATSVVIARPQAQFTPAMIATVDEYLSRGGALYIMADVMISDAPFLAEDSLFNRYLWENWGLRLLDAVVVDEMASGPTPLDVVSVAIFDSPITVNIDPAIDLDSRTQFRMARAIEVDDEPPVHNGHVIMSSPGSFGETDLERLLQTNQYEYDPEEDIQGPLTLVAFAQNAGTEGRVLLVGDSDFATNGQIRAPLGNAMLFTDGISWMTGFTEEVGFAPRAIAGQAPLIFVDTQTLDRIAFVTLLLMPGGFLLAGIGVWLRRSRR